MQEQELTMPSFLCHGAPTFVCGTVTVESVEP